MTVDFREATVSSRRQARAAAAVKRPSRRTHAWPRIEALEGRALLSTMFVDDDWAGRPNGTDLGDGRTFGTNAFGTIQAAINRATAGDEIRIAAGTYAETLVVNKQVSLVGAGADVVTLNVVAAKQTSAIDVTASGVSLGGFRVSGSTSNTTLRYGINVGPYSDLVIDGVAVESTSRNGVNLNRATNATISNTRVTNTTGAGLFFTDTKGVSLTNITTVGNEWAGMVFSTYGRYGTLGVEGVVIGGTNHFGESATVNGAIQFEEARWDSATGTFDLANPEPITFSTDLADGADVTFASGNTLRYVLSGPQDDTWVVRRRFYETVEQGLAAAEGSPSHYLPFDRTLSTFGALVEPRTFTVEKLPGDPMSIQAAIREARPGDAITVGAGTFAENLVIDKSVNLHGSSGVTVISPTQGAAIELRAGGASAASPLTLNDFRIAGGDYGISFTAAPSHVLLQGIEISGTTKGILVDGGATVVDLWLDRVDVSGNVVGLWVGQQASVNDLVITDSHFNANTQRGWLVLADPSQAENQRGFRNVEVRDTTFDDNGWSGIYAEKLDNATFTGIAARGNGISGIEFDLKYGAYSDLAIRDSILTGNGFSGLDAGWGLAVKARDDSPEFLANPASLSGLSILSNAISGNTSGILIGVGPESSGISGVGIHWNRIVANSAASLEVNQAAQVAAPVDASNNWWGSNSGPDLAASRGAIAHPHLVLRLTGAGSLGVGETASIIADLTYNSAGEDTSSLGRVPDGPIDFGTNLGAIEASSSWLVGGVSSFRFAAGTVASTAKLTATVDGAIASLDIDVRSPGLAISGPATLAQGEAYTLTLAADEDAGAVSLWWIDWGDGTQQSVPGGTAQVVHRYSGSPAAYTIRAQAQNELGTYPARDALVVTVQNQSPAAAIGGAPDSATQGTAIQLAGVASDPGEDSLSYAWTVSRDGEQVFAGDRPTLDFTPGAAGEYLVLLVVTDQHGASAEQSVVIPVANLAPAVEVAGITSGTLAMYPVSLTAIASDANPNATLAYDWVVTRQGNTVASGNQARLDFTPLLSGTYQATVRVTDGEGGLTSRTVSFDVTSSLPAQAERELETLQEQVDRVVERQTQRIENLVRRFDSSPPPFVERIISRLVQVQTRLQTAVARRAALFQRGLGRAR